MNNKPQRRSEQFEKENKQPGDLTSFNNRDTKRRTESEEAEKAKKIEKNDTQYNSVKEEEA